MRLCIQHPPEEPAIRCGLNAVVALLLFETWLQLANVKPSKKPLNCSSMSSPGLRALAATHFAPVALLLGICIVNPTWVWHIYGMNVWKVLNQLLAAECHQRNPAIWIL